jgi:hypothetical protein
MLQREERLIGQGLERIGHGECASVIVDLQKLNDNSKNFCIGVKKEG